MKRLLVLIGYLALLGIAISTYPTLTKRKRLTYTLAISRLSSLPPEALNTNVGTAGFFLAQTFWVAFKASDKDIQHWIRASPALATNTPIAFKKLTSAPDTSSTDAPSWFRPASISKGICYRISQTQHANYGAVWIDEKAGVVYIKVAHK